MNRLLIFLIIGFIAWLAIRSLRRPERTEKEEAALSKETDTESFVACARCGVHVPQNDAVRAGELTFCSDAHRQLGKADK